MKRYRYSFIEANNYTVERPVLSMATITDGSHTAFWGIADNEIFNTIDLGNLYFSLLVRAVNNRTRERNYFRLLNQLLEQEITEEEFDKELNTNPNDYVIRRNKPADENDIRAALDICPHLMDVEDVDTMADLFSFSHESIRKSLEER